MMKNPKTSLLFCLMILLMAAFPGKTIQADPTINKKHPVPFSASVKAIVTLNTPPPVADVTVNGYGNATHMGRIRFGAVETIVFDAAMNGDADQLITFTAANGDQLVVHANSNLTPVSVTPLIFYEEGSGTVTGGTGRFEGATGYIGLHATVNTENWVVQLSMNGNIMY